MKKSAGIISIVLALVMMFGACSGTPSNTEVSSSPAGEATSENNTTNSPSPSDTAQENNNSTVSDSVILSLDPESEPPAGFDPVLGWGGGGHTHDPLFQSTLLITNADLTIGNDLATGYTVSDDGLTWTFKVRKDVKFTDGEPLTAKDVAFTFNTASKQATENDFSMLDRVESTDDETAVFHLKKPFSPFAYLVAVIGIVPEHAYDSATYGRNPIGSGKYILKQWDKGEQIIMEANPDYYGEKAKMKQVTVVFMSEEASYAAAKSGQIDVAHTAPSFAINPIDGYKVISFEAVDLRGINLPCIPSGGSTPPDADGNTLPAGNDVTANIAVRKALAYCIDRDAIVKDVLYGYGKPAYGVGFGMPWDNPDLKYDFDPAKSKSIMEADGWVLGSDGVYEKNGLKAEFDLLYISSNSTRAGVAMAVIEMAKNVGIKINPAGGSWDQIADKTYATPHVFGTGQLSPTPVLARYHSSKNYASYSNSTVDGYIDQALKTPDMQDSYQYWIKAQWDGKTGVAVEGDMPWLWMVAVDHVYFTKNGLNAEDEKIHPHEKGWSITNNVDQWYWD